MDGGILKLLLPQIPSLATTALQHSIGRAPNSAKWDLRTTLTVQVIRRMMSGGNGERKPSVPMGTVQATTTKDLPIKGKMWVAKTKISAPGAEEEDVREKVWAAIEELRPEDSGEQLQYTRPGFEDVEVEWTGSREGPGKDEPLPQVSQEEMYERLMKEPSRTSDTTILYFHGGAYYLCDPATHRVLTARLAKESHGRVCSVRYRLAPQTAFPGQLLDALMVYLSLLYPPPESMHEAVPAKNIVFGGDSAGGNISFALLQLLLHFHRASPNPTARFHGKEVSIPLPAGVTSASPWLDICRCLPSILGNIGTDYLPPPNDDIIFQIPEDDVWPPNPRRGDIFCDLSLIDHPLASPIAAKDWKGSPPILINAGTESLSDEIRCVASIVAKQGNTIHYEVYDSMPHVFAMLLPSLETSRRCIRSWGDFCRRCVEEPEGLKTTGTFVHARNEREEAVDVATMECVSPEEARRLMVETKIRRMQVFEREQAKRGAANKSSL